MNKTQLLEILSHFDDGTAITEIIADSLPLREELPTKRITRRQKIYVIGQEIDVEVGFYEDGRAGEVFFEAVKEGHALRDLLDGLAIVLSISLQHGVPLDAFPLRGTGNDLTGEGNALLNAIFIALEDLCNSSNSSNCHNNSSPPTS